MTLTPEQLKERLLMAKVEELVSGFRFSEILRELIEAMGCVTDDYVKTHAGQEHVDQIFQHMNNAIAELEKIEDQIDGVQWD